MIPTNSRLSQEFMPLNIIIAPLRSPSERPQENRFHRTEVCAVVVEWTRCFFVGFARKDELIIQISDMYNYGPKSF